MKLTLPPAILFPIHAGNSARPARAALAGLLLFLSAAAAGAVELPAPEALERESGQARRVLEVAEPHATTPEEMVRVGYVALPMAPLLTHWFGENWKAPAAEVVFQARDGYRSALPGSKLAGGSAFLAFARADGRPFEVDNREQNEKVPLGPYYLIWDNLGTRELLSQGSSGWPYQVDRIELRQSGHDRLPRPRGSPIPRRSASPATNCAASAATRSRRISRSPSAAGTKRTSNAGSTTRPASVPAPPCPA
jgi:hypothetical protein